MKCPLVSINNIEIKFEANIGSDCIEVECKGVYTLREPGYSLLLDFTLEEVNLPSGDDLFDILNKETLGYLHNQGILAAEVDLLEIDED
jgi:hypothetical protein